jgi:hypothetical protein
MMTQTDNKVQMGYMTMSAIIASVASMLLDLRTTQYLPMDHWMKVNHNYFMHVPQAQRAAAIADQQALNEEARINAYPTIPAIGALAEAWKRYEAQHKKATVEIEIQARMMAAIRATLTTEQLIVMNEQNISTIHQIIEYLEAIYSVVPSNVAHEEFDKLEDKIQLPTNEQEKEQLIATIDAKYVNYFQNCLSDANDATKNVIIRVTRSRALEKTAYDCEELRIALSNLPANYTHQMLGDIIKNIIRNFKCDAISKANAAARKKTYPKKGGGGSKKESNKDEPEKHCKHHPDSTTHTTEQCYQTKREKKAKAAKVLKAAAKKDTSDSGTE